MSSSGVKNFVSVKAQSLTLINPEIRIIIIELQAAPFYLCAPLSKANDNTLLCFPNLRFCFLLFLSWCLTSLSPEEQCLWMDSADTHGISGACGCERLGHCWSEPRDGGPRCARQWQNMSRPHSGRGGDQEGLQERHREAQWLREDLCAGLQGQPSAHGVVEDGDGRLLCWLQLGPHHRRHHRCPREGPPQREQPSSTRQVLWLYRPSEVGVHGDWDQRHGAALHLDDPAVLLQIQVRTFTLHTVWAGCVQLKE